LVLQEYPGRRNPLDGVKKNQLSPENPDGGTGMFQYFLKVWALTFLAPHACQMEVYPSVRLSNIICLLLWRLQAVPTTYVDMRNNTIPTYQYSVTEYFKVMTCCCLSLLQSTSRDARIDACAKQSAVFPPAAL
jgi:hypothetical protein